MRFQSETEQTVHSERNSGLSLSGAFWRGRFGRDFPDIRQFTGNFREMGLEPRVSPLRNVCFSKVYAANSQKGGAGNCSVGSPQERIIDVVWSRDRVPDVNGKLPPIGNTVDPETSTYSNGNGAAELFGHWTDDDFDPGQHALYYMRVIEIPTPRWTTYDAVRHGLPLLEDVAVWI
ncbi:DUF3604 domain-containing protein [Ruegeria faecimaris]|uniref:DUF3604 domain-containing protein n=1 Tax=Ruegeria faecimaris TaxID=686389 RepID=UPI002492EFDE|nr:DUF3604 domain-containing protein [Ruegeria faecimaris]